MPRVLVVTNYWPPKGGMPVQRWLRIVPHLARLGWSPIIATPDSRHHFLRDDSLLDRVPPSVQVLRLPAWDPFEILYRLRPATAVDAFRLRQDALGSPRRPADLATAWVRGNLFFPDPGVFWVPSAVRRLLQWCHRHPIDAVVTTGPPHSLHLIGLALKRRGGIRWIADLRDLWSRWEKMESLHVSRPLRGLHAALERELLSAADVVTTVSPSWRRELEELSRRPVELLTNGYDPSSVPPSAPAEPARRFRLAHVGKLGAHRDVAALWECLRRLVSAGGEFARLFELVLAGPCHPDLATRLRSDPLLGPRLRLCGVIAQAEVAALYPQTAQLLLAVDRCAPQGRIPGKLFEYQAQRRSILAICPKESDVARLLSGSATHAVVDYDDIDGMAHAINACFERFLEGRVLAPPPPAKFGADALAASLVGLLEPWRPPDVVQGAAGDAAADLFRGG